MKKSSGFLSSVGALSAARALVLASQILVLPILARYLSPAEFGIAALAMSVAIFANMLSDGGMARSLIRISLKATDEWSSVFWFLIGLGFLLTAGLLGAAPAMAKLFDEPELLWPLAALSVMPLMLALSAAFAAEMEQRNAFAELALAQTVAASAGFVAAVWMAWAGFGVWALIAQQLLLTAVRAVWVAFRSRFRPRWFFSRTALANHFAFGRDITAAAILNYLREQSTTLVVGKVLGAAELGIYAMTMRFLRLPMYGLAGPFGQVLYVRLSKNADRPDEFRATFLAATRLLALALLPPMAAVAVVSDTAFPLLLSDRWSAVAPIFMLAAGGAALLAVTNPSTVALNALGQTTRRLWLAAEIAISWMIFLSFSVGYGLEAIALSRTLWMLLMLPRNWSYLSRACNITAMSYISAFIPGILASAFVLVTLNSLNFITTFSGWIWVAVGVVAWLTCACATYALFRQVLTADFRKLI